MHHISNQDIARILHEMAGLLEMDEVDFKPRAYEKAALGVESLDREARDMYKENGITALMEIPGVGRGIAEHMENLFKNGHFKEYEKLKKKIPVDIEGLAAIEGVGPKMILKLYKKLGIRNRNQLEKAVAQNLLSKKGGFGKKTEENILRSIGFLKKEHGRYLLGDIMPTADKILERIKVLPGVEDVYFGGSLRRMKETVGDLDFIAFSNNPAEVVKKFVTFSEVESIHEQGKHKALVRLNTNNDADLWVMPPQSRGAALIAWTGDKQHNIALRTIAEKKGWILNDYGLYKRKKLLASKTEEEVYKKLGLQYIEPEMRECAGEIELARKNKLPSLVGYRDLKGDLQVQTDWTDGEHSILEMAHAAQKHGLSYIAITDHTKSLAMTGGSDEKKLLCQMKEIKKLNKKISAQGGKNFTILSGAEVNIMKDGFLDIEDAVLKQLDVVGAAVHSHFGLSRAEQTARVIRAMENPHVDIIFHLTGRVIGRREAIDIDVEKIIEVARRTKTVLEIDAYPERLDIKDIYIKKCVEAGVKMVIDSDAHSVKHFKYLELGIAQARRGWAKKSDILNTKSVKEFLKSLK